MVIEATTRLKEELLSHTRCLENAIHEQPIGALRSV